MIKKSVQYIIGKELYMENHCFMFHVLNKYIFIFLVASYKNAAIVLIEF